MIGPPQMQLHFAKSLCASSFVHGAVLVAVVGFWVVPEFRSRGRDRVRDVHIELAQIERLEFAPPAPLEPLEPLELLEETEIVPETLELPLPARPIEEETFRPVDFEAPPSLDLPFRPRRQEAPLEPAQAPPLEPAPEPPQTAAQEPVGEPEPVVARPTPIHNPKPKYPQRAVSRRIEGSVTLLLVVDVGGRVTEARVTESSGSILLDRSALSAVEGWLFEPGRRGDEAVEMELPWRLVFSLGG